MKNAGWAGLLRDWDRSLRAGNHPETTRYNYLLAAVQLAGYLVAEDPDSGGARDPGLVTRRQVVAFQAWMVESRSAGTALNKYKALLRFFGWLVEEGEVACSPMVGVPMPRVGQKLVPIMTGDETRRLLAECQGKEFAQVRDQALIRMYCSTGARLSEIGGLLVADVDLDTESVLLHGKGAKDRRVRFGPNTARALSRYLRLRGRREGAAEMPQLWVSVRGMSPLRPAGIKVRLKRLGQAAGVEHVYAHRWRHSFAHEWKLLGGNEGDLMLLMGWSSDEMPRRYGLSAAAERAQELQLRFGIGERF
ncbi:integrase [Actinoplanes sp. ATCC 53533]|nr:integrase [Actinoplanes sp. ATCC 53533]